MAQIKVTLTRSLIGYPKDQRATVRHFHMILRLKRNLVPMI